MYLTSPANTLDWCHFVLMVVGWRLWYQHVALTAAFHMDTSYGILHSPSDKTRARFFLTDPREELKFLRFSKALGELERSLSNYVNITSICGALRDPSALLHRLVRILHHFLVPHRDKPDRDYRLAVILFVLRMLKALDFQPRMALITRTISRCSALPFPLPVGPWGILIHTARTPSLRNNSQPSVC